MSSSTFARCQRCGNVITYIEAKGPKVFCCNQLMNELPLNATDAPGEKHLPTFFMTQHQISVEVGSTLHPMTDSHYIAWIYLETTKTKLLYPLNHGQEPRLLYSLQNDEDLIAIYSYCNLHGLWKATK